MLRREGFAILELNGAASEATSAYDFGKSLREAYRVLFRQWDLVFAIGDENREDSLAKILSECQKCSLCHPLPDRAMCSVSFLPREDGFILAMNRDERLSRASALPPEVFERDGLAMLYPRELSGGTWIGVNSAGAAFSLINWYSQPDCAYGNPVSRGEVVRALLSARNCAAAASLLGELPLKRMNPFRLMAVNPSERSLTEWRSSGRDLERFTLPWKRHHWFSSALDEGKANQMRRRVCARMHGDSFDLPSLRKLHRSHAPKAGPFSLCMHRNDARTVSYTEINVRGPMASAYYIAGPPCSRSPRFRASFGLDVEAVLRKVA